MSIEDFRSKEDIYITCVASAAQVPTSSVQILSVSDVSARRVYGVTERTLLTLSTLVQVETKVSSTTDHAMLISQDRFNSYLEASGMPKATLTVLSGTQDSTSPTSPAMLPTQTSAVSLIVGANIAFTTTPAPATVLTSNASLIYGAIAGVAFIVVFVIVGYQIYKVCFSVLYLNFKY